MNAKNNLLEQIKDNKVDYVQIYGIDYADDESYTELTIMGTLDDVLPQLDNIDYNKYYNIVGTIWYTRW